MKAVRHTGIVIRNMDKSLHFYRDLLGFKIVKKMEEAGSYISTVCGISGIQVTTIKMTADDSNLIELLFFHNPAPRMHENNELNDAGYSHIACTVENIDAEYARLTGAGIHFNSTPQISPDGYAKVAFCRDPDGNYIELVEVLTDVSHK